jgi:hypothetical protein
MLFLLNDVMLTLDARGAPPLNVRSMDALSPQAITRLAQELYAEEPLLHRRDPERASRLALLIASKTPDINAALFAAPAKGCSPEAVAVRYASLPIESISELYMEHKARGLSPVLADRMVWRRLAA